MEAHWDLHLQSRRGLRVTPAGSSRPAHNIVNPLRKRIDHLHHDFLVSAAAALGHAKGMIRIGEEA
jgi:hypothetical protein